MQMFEDIHAQREFRQDQAGIVTVGRIVRPSAAIGIAVHDVGHHQHFRFLHRDPAKGEFGEFVKPPIKKGVSVDGGLIKQNASKPNN